MQRALSLTGIKAISLSTSSKQSNAYFTMDTLRTSRISKNPSISENKPSTHYAPKNTLSHNPYNQAPSSSQNSHQPNPLSTISSDSSGNNPNFLSQNYNFNILESSSQGLVSQKKKSGTMSQILPKLQPIKEEKFNNTFEDISGISIFFFDLLFLFSFTNTF